MTSALLAIALLYPTVARTGTNLLERAAWTHGKDEPGAIAFATAQGGPLSATGRVYRVETFRQTSAYWHTRAKALPGREYLFGCWLRIDHATVLLWTRGRNAETGAEDQFRLYCKSGFQPYLKPYISPEVAQRLGGDPAEWRLCFRMLRFQKRLAGDTLYVSAGCYGSTGAVQIADPFLVDVTDCTDWTLTAELRGCRPVTRMELFRVGIRDLVWKRAFERPVTDGSFTVPADLADFRLGQEEEANFINGHGLDVFHADGSSQTVFAPQEHVYRVWTDY